MLAFYIKVLHMVTELMNKAKDIIISRLAILSHGILHKPRKTLTHL